MFIGFNSLLYITQDVSCIVNTLLKNVLGPLELELQSVGNYLMWVLGTKLWSSHVQQGLFTCAIYEQKLMKQKQRKSANNNI